MNGNSSMLLICVGTAGCLIARGVSRAFGEDLRYLLTDTDAASGVPGGTGAGTKSGAPHERPLLSMLRETSRSPFTRSRTVTSMRSTVPRKL